MKNKKLIVMLSALTVACSCVNMPVSATDNIAENTEITVLNSPELWEKFLKYDLCITDYNSLTDEEKDICRFIFETEQSTKDTIRCERARRTLAHDENIGERLTLDVLENPDFFGICDKYFDFNFGKHNFIHCVPDIINLDYDFTYEYWLDDDGDNRIVTGMYGSFVGLKMLNNDDNKEYLDSLRLYYTVVEDNINGKEYLCTDENIAKSMDEEKLIESEGNTYYLCPDNTLTLIKSKYKDSSYCRAPVEEPVIIPEEVNGYPVTAIERDTFNGTTITKVILPETIECINASAFCNCQLLEEVNFPYSLKYIGNRAFYQTSLKEIKINCSELDIARDAFSEVPAVIVEINAKSIGEYAFAGCFNIEILELGKDIKEIKSRAFWGNNLTDIKLPENLKYLGIEAFYAYPEDGIYKKITIPKSVEIIGILPLSQGISSVSYGEIPAVNSLLQDYECVFPINSEISGYYGTEAYNYAVSNNFIFNPLDDLLFGDANGDGEIAISDMVALQKYLLNNGNVGYEADVNKDGRIDVFDMVLLRKTILNIR